MTKQLKSDNPNSYAGYLTAIELCDQSDLRPSDLERLASARLLLADRPSGLYRPKLVGWARKLAFLLAENWSPEEIRAWAKGRWKTANPRLWPPDREEWSHTVVSKENVDSGTST